MTAPGERATAPDDATRAQITAADPRRSTWLSANAGSGKTRVLTDRVAQLLLKGVPPQNVLCLTYTKAAASEMQNRLFRQLGGWAMLDDAVLRAELAAKGVSGPLSGDRLDSARRLFARAIEAPGGLKIQTIHAFCAALLRRFPLEARVPLGFAELDERSAANLRDEVLETLSDGPEGDAVDAVAAHLGGDDAIGGICTEILRHREAFFTPLDLARLKVHLGLEPDFDAATLVAEVFLGGEACLLSAMFTALSEGSTNDVKAACALRPLVGQIGTAAALPGLEGLLLTGAGAKSPFSAKIDSFPTKATRGALGESAMSDLRNLMLRVEAARPRRLALEAAERSAALHRFAAAFLPAMAARKAAQGLLDFDDLILTARALMEDPATGDWVLYKLDGGIDHILVDEAQDTSPAQWDLIRLLAREIAAGHGTRGETTRTIFVVGDKKQSIYSFQGADPQEFDRLRGVFSESLAEGPGLATSALSHSFRSAPAILRAVDATFAGPAAEGVGGAPSHLPFKAALPGRVDLWPQVVTEKTDENPDWTAPRDRISPRAAAARLADSIAGELRRLIDCGTPIPGGDGGAKLLDEGDVLILVQRRGALFREIIRACKARGLAIAGADRLKLTTDLAVQDLLSLLSFLALPEDDLALAEALRSPLFGWDEDALYRLAQPRAGYLWEEMRRTHAGTLTLETLQDLRDKADFMRPYDLLERILTHHQGRTRLLARLGPDCEEAVDALLGEALAYERADVPSLTGFIEWLGGEKIEIKRQADRAGRALRVMTVHGAKGLESPLVILPDCGPRRAPRSPPVLLSEGVPLWTVRAGTSPERLASAEAAWKAAQAAERDRLLYVAMTRAETWLWVCAAGEESKTETWHTMVAAGLDSASAAPLPTPTGPGLRLESGDWAGLAPRAGVGIAEAALALPVWASLTAPPPPEEPPIIAPSGLGGAKALPGDSGGETAEALARGRQIHLLLEHLPDYPQASWIALAPNLLATDEEAPHPTDIEGLVAEAAAVLSNPALAHLFAPGTLAERAFTAALPDGSRLHGTIDRLIVTPERVLAVDFKSNAVIPDTPAEVPEGLLRQMGAYDVALRLIYPGRIVETALLWTRGARLMLLPQELVQAALARRSTA